MVRQAPYVLLPSSRSILVGRRRGQSWSCTVGRVSDRGCCCAGEAEEMEEAVDMEEAEESEEPEEMEEVKEVEEAMEAEEVEKVAEA